MIDISNDRITEEQYRSDKMTSVIGITIYVCPICGFKSFDMFPVGHWEAGSDGRRTYSCPGCNAELE